MINKSTIPQVAYAVMNTVHDEEAEILNSLEALLAKETADMQSIEDTLQQLLAHTKQHFANEEQLMHEVSFPALMMHEAEHHRVLNEMQTIIKNWQLNKDNAILKSYFLDTLQVWLMHHINTMDTMTAQFICAHKGCA